MESDLGKLIVAKGFVKFKKCKKPPNLVTLHTTDNHTTTPALRNFHFIFERVI